MSLIFRQAAAAVNQTPTATATLASTPVVGSILMAGCCVAIDTIPALPATWTDLGSASTPGSGVTPIPRASRGCFFVSDGIVNSVSFAVAAGTNVAIAEFLLVTPTLEASGVQTSPNAATWTINITPAAGLSVGIVGLFIMRPVTSAGLTGEAIDSVGAREYFDNNTSAFFGRDVWNTSGAAIPLTGNHGIGSQSGAQVAAAFDELREPRGYPIFQDPAYV